MTQAKAPRSSDLTKQSPCPDDSFVRRHIGPSDEDVQAMLAVVGHETLDALIDATVPEDIRLSRPLHLPPARSEAEMLKELAEIASGNHVMRSMIGMGYHGCITPPVIQRNILENPLWYTAYTPYQAEIAQGRLEALLNFQTMVADLCALPLANASLLDEATAAAEAMAMCHSVARGTRPTFLVGNNCHPQTISVVRTRAWSMGLSLKIVDPAVLSQSVLDEACGVLVQYPATDGSLEDYSQLCERVHQAGGLVVAACDILALVLLKPPGNWGADIAVGSTQRFGVPMGFGGPHAGFLATQESFGRKMPGRIVGVSRDSEGRRAYRLAIQTREQHIKRDRATSNICTAQVLLAIIAGMYAVWHGPGGLQRIAQRVHGLATAFAHSMRQASFRVCHEAFFDTVAVVVDDADAVISEALNHGINLRRLDAMTVAVSFDETTTEEDLQSVVAAFDGLMPNALNPIDCVIATPHAREGDLLAHPVFNSYHSEHELLRYITRLQSCDVSLGHSMIPLGSCTMKLNAAAEMQAVTWPGFAELHPYAPSSQVTGYERVSADLRQWLCEITGFVAVSLQPNAGSQGEYAGLLAIRRHHIQAGQEQRRICLIPTSAHGTNPASAIIAGFEVVPITCDEQGNIDLNEFEAQIQQAGDRLGALMVTYPSTHGVFEQSIRQLCQQVHTAGGQVYMDGANMNAQVGLCRPADIGADVCHLNLHKTFCIPHGGGGPGMGPIAVAKHLEPFLPGHPLEDVCSGDLGSEDTREPPVPGHCPISAAPEGSPLLLPISWMYIAMMGAGGLTRASEIAILNANYVACRLSEHYDVLYCGHNGTVGHEGIIDCRVFDRSADVRVEDIAKRLMDFGFHAPTISWPVAGTMMIEPTESESKAELDRFCDAMIAIRREIAEIEEGRLDRRDNPLKNAPHTASMVCADVWIHGYSRSQAAFPVDWLTESGRKFWPAAARIDNAYGDRNLVCTCPSLAEMLES